MHETEIISYEKLSDGQFVITIRCCGDEAHTYKHTIGPEIISDSAKTKASIEAARERAAQIHQCSQLAEEQLKSLVGDKRNHGS